MEIGVGNGCCSRRSEKESTKLGDLLLIQINGRRNSFTGLTLSDVLGEQSQRPPPVQSNRTLLDVIHEDDPNKKNQKKRSWKSFTEKPRSSKINVEINPPLPSNQLANPEVGKSLMELMEGDEEEEEEEEEEETGERLPEVGLPLMVLLTDTHPEMESEGPIQPDEEEEKQEQGMELNKWCCVCMMRQKGAAFIPCGHAFCRLCSRELWVQRGCCPLCNVFILEILHIF